MIIIRYDRKKEDFVADQGGRAWNPDDLAEAIRRNGIPDEIIGYMAPQNIEGGVKRTMEITDMLERAYRNRPHLYRV